MLPGEVSTRLAPDCAHVALQPCVRVWPAGKSNASVQPLSAVVPVFVTLTAAVNPLDQPLAVYATEHEPVATSGAVDAVSAADAADTLPAASFARTVKEYDVPAVSPVTVYDGVVVDPTSVVPRYTS